MRDELARLLQERVGLDQQKAEMAADVAIDFIRQRAPEPFRSMLGGGAAGGGGSVLGSVFGGGQSGQTGQSGPSGQQG